jgi:Zn-dependent protease/predicted transcriptional regulator
MQGSFKLGTLGGIDIRLHYTWLLAFFLIAWSLALGYFSMSGPARDPVTDWTLGIVAALLLFASILLHELGHSFVARSRGLRVDNITLFIFGGVSNLTKEAATARDEFFIAVVGPVISVVLAGAFWVIGSVLPPASAVSALAGYLVIANLLLAAFNLVPGFPLDGGRVLRSIVWGATGDMTRATRIASYIGQAVAFVLIGWGVLSVLTGNVFGGLWIAFIGWFLNSGAEASRQQAIVENALAGVPVSSAMDGSVPAISPELSVREFVMEHAVRRGQRALPVVDSGQLVGIMSVTDAQHLEQEAWSTTRIGEVMTRMPLKTLSPDADLAAALQLMVESNVHQLPVVQGGTLVGLVTRAGVMRYMQAGLRPSERGAGQTQTVAATPKSAPAHG